MTQFEKRNWKESVTPFGTRCGFSSRTSVAIVSVILLQLVSSLSGQSLRLAWVDRSDNEDGFFIERACDGETFSLVAETGANENAFSDFDVIPGKNYQYRICSFNAFGCSDYLDAEDVFSIEEPQAPSFVAKVDNDVDPIVSNGGFDSKLAPWRFYTNGSGSARPAVVGYEGVGKALQVRLDRFGNNMQLFQNSLVLEADTEYELSFAAYSNSGRDMKVTLAKHKSPYTNYGLQKEAVELDTEWKVVRIRFTTENFSNSAYDGRLYFWFADDAYAGDRYVIDDVRLQKVADMDPEFGYQDFEPDPDIGDDVLEMPDSTGSVDEVYESDDGTDDAADDATSGSGSTENSQTDDTQTGSGSENSDTATGDDDATQDNEEPAEEVATPDFGNASGVIENGGFEQDLSAWRFYTSGKGRAYLNSPGYQDSENSVIVRLDSAAKNIQLFQNDIKLLPNTPYRLTFAAYCNLGRDMSVSIGKHSTPYTNYGLNAFPIDLQSGWQVYTVQFTTENFDKYVEDGRLFFWFAEKTWGGERFYIDNVSLTALPDVDAPSVPGALDVVRVSATEAHLEWTASTDNGGMAGYIVYRDGIDIGSSYTAEFIDRDAQGEHVYTVTAFDSDGNESAPSDPAPLSR